MRSLRHIFHLGIKELSSLRHDPVLVIFIVYVFTLDVLTAIDQSVQVENASIAIVDEDRSQLSQRIANAFFQPEFQRPDTLSVNQINHALNAGKYTFVVDIPPNFAADLKAGRRPSVQVNVDATAVAQAFTGSAYIREIINQEVVRHQNAGATAPDPPARATVGVRFNQNTQPEWFFSVAELLQMITALTMLLPAAALIREQEHGTIEHLLVMPLAPAEIMLAKIWSNALVVQIGTLFCLTVIIQWYLGVPLKGSIPLFLFGTFIYQFTVTAIGMALATVVKSVAQFVLLMVLVITPMIFLSGIFTPIESMPQALSYLMVISPMRYYVDFSMAVLFRDAGLQLVVFELLVMAGIGAVLFSTALVRFRKHFSTAGS